jgi:hypothetical protein
LIPHSIAQRRLARQRLVGQPLVTPAEVVAWLGAMQSQDYFGALWSLGMRLEHATEATVEAAFNAGDILRTHALRPTWHFVAPADIRWLLELTAPRVKAASAYMLRKVELDDRMCGRCNAIIANAVQGGNYLTRVEIGVALAAAGIHVDGMRLTYIAMNAELDAVICSGPRRGKQFTYALLAERAPQARSLARDAALAELTRRYFTGHGPATARDFAWWSGMTLADAQAGIALVQGELTRATIDGQTYWFAADTSPVTDPSRAALLLPTYDEMLIGYAGFGEALTGGQAAGRNETFTATIALEGQVVGNWRRTLTPKAVVVATRPFAPLAAEAETSLTEALARYGAFLGKTVEQRRV